MSEPFEIGISLAFGDGVLEGIEAAKRDMRAFEQAMHAGQVSVARLREAAAGAVAAPVAAGGGKETGAARDGRVQGPLRSAADERSPLDGNSARPGVAAGIAVAGASRLPPPPRRRTEKAPPGFGSSASYPRPQDRAIDPAVELHGVAAERPAALETSGALPRPEAQRTAVTILRMESSVPANSPEATPSPHGMTVTAMPYRADVHEASDAPARRVTATPEPRSAAPPRVLVSAHPQSDASARRNKTASVDVSSPTPRPGGPSHLDEALAMRAPASPTQSDLLPASPASEGLEGNEPEHAPGAPSAAGTAALERPPIEGDVYLDGLLVGRWMSRFLAAEAGRASGGPTGFDSRRNPLLPGSTVGV